MNNIIRITISWIIALWISKVFIGSLFYKFDKTALEPQHIFSTVGTWIGETLNTTLGELFTEYGAVFIGLAELATALVLLAPIVLWKHRAKLHCIGGLMASVVMTGAIFFHLFTPLGWHPTWSVDNEAACQAVFSDPGLCTDTALANAALSIFVLGIVLLLINRKS